MARARCSLHSASQRESEGSPKKDSDALLESLRVVSGRGGESQVAYTGREGMGSVGVVKMSLKVAFALGGNEWEV